MTESRTGRLPALDGLRGLAALVVVLHHAALVAPGLAAAYRAGQPTPTGWAAVAVYSPLHLLWAGPEAVSIFFVLSGLVLTLPFLRRRPDWLAYYPRRLVRLYVPVWGGVLFAVLCWLAVRRNSQPGLSWWVNRHDIPLRPRVVFNEMTLLFGTNNLNSVLWSLKYEVLFSLLLPVFLVLGLRWRRGAWVKAVLVLALVEVGVVTDRGSLGYLAIFALGVLIAVERERIRALVERTGAAVLWTVCGVGLLMLDAVWLAGGREELAPVSVAGAAVLVTLFAFWRPAQRLGQRGVVQWLGRVSFSLYLVHEPIVVSAAFLVRSTDPFLMLAVALPASLLIAEGFYRVVEAPAHRLSQTVGRYAAARRPGGRVLARSTP